MAALYLLSIAILLEPSEARVHLFAM